VTSIEVVKVLTLVAWASTIDVQVHPLVGIGVLRKGDRLLVSHLDSAKNNGCNDQAAAEAQTCRFGDLQTKQKGVYTVFLKPRQQRKLATLRVEFFSSDQKFKVQMMCLPDTGNASEATLVPPIVIKLLDLKNPVDQIIKTASGTATLDKYEAYVLVSDDRNLGIVTRTQLLSPKNYDDVDLANTTAYKIQENSCTIDVPTSAVLPLLVLQEYKANIDCEEMTTTFKGLEKLF